jgi:type I restriction enzyme S subunit
MNAERLLQHFDRISETPDAIPRLRQFILELAVRGKLVSQDPNDEPAAQLLKRIQAEKERLVQESVIKRLEKFEPVEASEFPFAIPAGWEASRMGWLARKLGTGSTPLGGKSVYQSEGVPFLRSQNIHNEGLCLDDVALITRSIHERMLGTHVQKQDILLNITGASIGRCALVPETFTEGNVSQHVAIVRLFAPEIRGFIHLSLISPFFQRLIDDVQVGVSREGLSMQRLRLFPMLLPPLAEQHRIVAKVDKLMALCNQLEVAKTEREQSHDRLVAASLHRLNSPADTAETDAPDLPAWQADAFRDHARFVFNHLPLLTTRPEHIKQLRQTILNLAVRGKLVPQDPNDEPAAELLKRIQEKKAQLVKEGNIKKPKTGSLLPKDKLPFDVPDNWIWIPFSDLISHSDAGVSPKTEGFPKSGNAWGVLKVSAVSWDKFNSDENKQLLPGATFPESAQVHMGDFLISRANTSELLAKCVIVEDQPKNIILSDKIVRLHIMEYCEKKFLCFVNNHSAYARSYYASKGSGTSHSMKNVSRPIIYALPIPLPPLAEQNRIVARVDELMALCDQLEAQLTATGADSRRLLEAVLHEALAPALEETV